MCRNIFCYIESNSQESFESCSLMLDIRRRWSAASASTVLSPLVSDSLRYVAKRLESKSYGLYIYLKRLG